MDEPTTAGELVDLVEAAGNIAYVDEQGSVWQFHYLGGWDMSEWRAIP